MIVTDEIFIKNSYSHYLSGRRQPTYFRKPNLFFAIRLIKYNCFTVGIVKHVNLDFYFSTGNEEVNKVDIQKYYSPNNRIKRIN